MEHNPMIAAAGSDDIEPITPEEAVNWYLEDRQGDVSEHTLQAHTYRLNHFIRWCDKNSIDNMNDISGRAIKRYKTWRQRDGNLNSVSIRTQMATFRVFLKWCESIQAVRVDTYRFIDLSQPDGDGGVDSRILSPDQADDILGHLRKFEYGSLRHVLMELLWVTGMRTGSVRALDVEDYDSENAKLQVRHRPETDTPLKNKKKGERNVSLREKTCLLFDDYVAHSRLDTADDYGRNPLLSTSHGRVSRSHIRKLVYTVSQPCYYGSCPLGTNPEECEFREADHRGGCPENVSPHAVRRGSITWALRNSLPQDAVSARMNVSQGIIEKHYYHATKDEKMEARRDHFDNL